MNTSKRILAMLLSFLMMLSVLCDYKAVFAEGFEASEALQEVLQGEVVGRKKVFQLDKNKLPKAAVQTRSASFYKAPAANTTVNLKTVGLGSGSQKFDWSTFSNSNFKVWFEVDGRRIGQSSVTFAENGETTQYANVLWPQNTTMETAAIAAEFDGHYDIRVEQEYTNSKGEDGGLIFNITVYEVPNTKFKVEYKNIYNQKLEDANRPSATDKTVKIGTVKNAEFALPTNDLEFNLRDGDTYAKFGAQAPYGMLNELTKEVLNGFTTIPATIDNLTSGSFTDNNKKYEYTVAQNSKTDPTVVTVVYKPEVVVPPADDFGKPLPVPTGYTRITFDANENKTNGLKGKFTSGNFRGKNESYIDVLNDTKNKVTYDNQKLKDEIAKLKPAAIKNDGSEEVDYSYTFNKWSPDVKQSGAITSSDKYNATYKLTDPIITETEPKQEKINKYVKIIFVPNTKVENNIPEYGNILTKLGNTELTKNYKTDTSLTGNNAKAYWALKTATWDEVRKFKDDNNNIVFTELKAENNETDVNKKAEHEFMGWHIEDNNKLVKANPFETNYKASEKIGNRDITFISRFQTSPYMYFNSDTQNAEPNLDIDGYLVYEDEYNKVTLKTEDTNKGNLKLTDAIVQKASKTTGNKVTAANSSTDFENLYLYVRKDLENASIPTFGTIKSDTNPKTDYEFWYWDEAKNAKKKVEDKVVVAANDIYTAHFVKNGQKIDPNDPELPKDEDDNPLAYKVTLVKGTGIKADTTEDAKYGTYVVFKGKTLSEAKVNIPAISADDTHQNPAWYDGDNKVGTNGTADELKAIAITGEKTFTSKADSKPSSNQTDTPTITEPKAGDKTITGTSEHNAKVVVELPDGTKIETTANGEGKWTAKVPEGKELIEGQTVKAKATVTGKTESKEATATVNGKGIPTPSYNYLTLTLDENYRGGEITHHDVYKDDLIERYLYRPRRRGYVFEGWSYNSRRLDEVRPGDRIEYSTTLYAIWSKQKPKDDEEVEPIDTREVGEHKAYMFGYTDGTVRPNGYITRAEAAALVTRLLGLDTFASAAEPAFTDTPSSWYNKAINAAVNRGIMKGYPDKSFRPNAPITRAEFTQMISTIDNKPYGVAPFADVVGHWAERPIGSEYQAGRIKGYPDGTFRPNAFITRCEAVVILNKIFERNFDAMSLKDAKNAYLIKGFIDLPTSFWGYYDMIEATNSHSFKRRVEGKVQEDWTLVK